MRAAPRRSRQQAPIYYPHNLRSLTYTHGGAQAALTANVKALLQVFKAFEWQWRNGRKAHGQGVKPALQGGGSAVPAVDGGQVWQGLPGAGHNRRGLRLQRQNRVKRPVGLKIVAPTPEAGAPGPRDHC
jgi:hypothetical protein